MKLTPVNDKELYMYLMSRKIRRPRKLEALIEEFVKSEADLARLDFGPEEYKNIQSAAASMNKAVKRSGHRIKVIVKEGSMYLVRLSPEKEEKQ